MTLAPERSRLVALMERTVDDETVHGNWHYLAIRPQVIPVSYGGPSVEQECDCSDGCRCLCRWAGVKDDPAGNGYASYGNSTSIYYHLHTIPLASAQPGDICTFGFVQGEHHALMLWEKYGTGDYDWYVWNMGTQGQPVKHRLVDEISYHSGMTVTCKGLNVADPPPTPQEKLQAETGFFSWMSWLLGENAWKKYGQKNATVRPNVPKVIPPSWWKHRVQFLLARKNANT